MYSALNGTPLPNQTCQGDVKGKGEPVTPPGGHRLTGFVGLTRTRHRASRDCRAAVRPLRSRVPRDGLPERVPGPCDGGRELSGRDVGFALLRRGGRRLCQLLLGPRGGRMTRDLACEELFPRLAPRAAARSLSKGLSMARAALADLGEPGAALLGADLTHMWLSPRLEVDADLQADALRAGLGLGPGLERGDVLSAALAQDGQLLSDEPYAEWADRARERLDALRQEARLVLARDRAKGAGRGAPD